MATGLRQIVSPETDGSTQVIAGSFANAASASGNGWSMARTGTGVYTLTLTNVSSILSVVSSIAWGTESEMEAVLDKADIGIGYLTVPSSTAGTVAFSMYNEVDLNGEASVAAVMPAGATLHFIIVASYHGK